ncbi:MAG: tRNA (adenosine(37)-N6)-threonylcarbamoyltransferase complex transferase subunit TsaD [Chlamydiae bacterium]|nr:tRNA (adenosine(37)-N6)-threonylcarbamoyltransferase complex transferase subunit TsaD [Chlamydiota bacterium]MBI3277165.1 tRNA (adenosine(37)-N6)-threonylcarbamoyltransferase complex transferase subunit TsaD [Chlamydiota bacterium]
MLVLGIETSCDETAACVLEGGMNQPKILSNVISSQWDLHHAYGGVVPELASRRHVEIIRSVVEESLREAHQTLSQIDLMAVTTGPGLVGALLIGVTFAKTISTILKKPLMGINHLEAHLYASFLEDETMDFPLVSLIVSGGHTELVWVKKLGQYEVLGKTFDDAAGEAYDKVAKLLGLGYPGGPVIDQLAKNGNSKAFRFPRPMLSKSSLDFSFSGLKTAVLYLVKGYGAQKKTFAKWDKERTQDLAASFQETVVEVLTEKCLRALKKTGCHRLAIGGGVAANSRLRERLQELSKAEGFQLSLPSRKMCTDNGAMIAGLAYAYHQAGLPGEPLDVNPGMKIQKSNIKNQNDNEKLKMFPLQ